MQLEILESLYDFPEICLKVQAYLRSPPSEDTGELLPQCLGKRIAKNETPGEDWPDLVHINQCRRRMASQWGQFDC